MDKKELSRRLDLLVSVIVRNEETRCVTCGKYLPYKKRQAGHYLPREIRATRWVRENVHVQCAKCNVELGGNLEAYRQYLNLEGSLGLMEFLDETYDDYKHGRSKEPSLEEMKMLYNFFLGWVGGIEARKGKTYIPQEWRQID